MTEENNHPRSISNLASHFAEAGGEHIEHNAGIPVPFEQSPGGLSPNIAVPWEATVESAVFTDEDGTFEARYSITLKDEVQAEEALLKALCTLALKIKQQIDMIRHQEEREP